MKHLFLKSWLMIACLILGLGTSWATEIKFDFKTLQTTSGTVNGIDWETGKTGSANATACNSTNGLVLYGVSNGGGYFNTTSATSGAITKVVLNTAAKKNTPTYTAYVSSNGTDWTELESNISVGAKTINVSGSYTYFKIQNTTGATAQLGVADITITYTSGTPSGDPQISNFIKTSTLNLETGADSYDVRNALNIPNDYPEGTVGAYNITTTINGLTQKDGEFACAYPYLSFQKAGNYTVNVTAAAVAGKYAETTGTIAVTVTEPVVTLTTMDEIFAAATEAASTATDVNVTFNNWVVSGVKSNNAYVTDNAGKGFIIFTRDHGFEVGDILSGTAACKVQLYNASAELTNLTSTTTGLTVTKGGVVTPVTTMALADLSGANTGAVLSFQDLEYDGTNFTDGEIGIKPYNTFITLPTLVSGKNYDVTGVYIQFNTTKEIAPRAVEDFVLDEKINYYTVTFDVTENGTITVKDGETVINEGDEVAEGTTLTIECTPASEDYRFQNWQYKVGEAAWATRYTNPQDYTMPSANVQFKANFELIPVYTVAFSVNGDVQTADLKEGAAVTAPEVSDMGGKVFTGWIETATVEGETPAYVTPITTATKTVTYYAVFATKEGEGETCYKLIESELEDWTGDYLIVYNNTYAMNTHSGNQNANTFATYSDISEYYTESTKSIASNSNTDALVYRAAQTTNGYSLYCVSDESYLGITANTTSTGSKLRWNTSYTESADDWTLGVGSIGNVGSKTLYIRWNNNSGTYRFAAYASTGQQAIQLFKKEDGANYSNFTTVIPTTLNIVINSVAKDGDFYYATFSSEYAWVVSEDLIVSEAKVVNSTLVFESYNTNDVVPANTGVLVSALEYGTYSVTVSNEPGESVLGVNNMLYPASKDKDELKNHKFYMLARDTNGENLGFYYGKEDGAAFTSREGSAYLAVPAGPSAPVRFVFGAPSVVTSVENAESGTVTTKTLVNGQLYIIREGNTYDMVGNLVK